MRLMWNILTKKVKPWPLLQTSGGHGFIGVLLYPKIFA